MAKYTSRNLNEQKGLTTRAKWGISLLVVCSVLFLCVVTNFITPIRSFILGTFGLCVYPILLVLIALGILLLMKKQYYVAKVYLATVISLFFILVCFFQLVLTDFSGSLGDYIVYCYDVKTTAGGVLIGIFTYGLNIGLGLWGTILFLVIAIIICIAFIVDHFLKMREYREVSSRTLSYPDKNEKQAKIIEPVKVADKKEKKIEKKEAEATKIALDAYMDKQQEAKKTLLSKTSYQNEAEMAVKIFGQDFVNSIKNSGDTEDKKQNGKKEYTLSELYQENKNKSNNSFIARESTNSRPSRFIHNEDEKPVIQTKFDFNNSNSFENFKKSEENKTPFEQNNKDGTTSSVKKESFEKNMEKVVGDINELDLEDKDIRDIIAPKPPEKVVHPIPQFKPEQVKIPEVQNEKIHKKHRVIPYIRPPIDLLTTQSTQIEEDEESYQLKALTLEETLDSFKIPAKVMGITRGPAVTRYELQMPSGISVKRIAQHSDDIAMMMESRGSVRIETPIPGRNLVGVEIPNDQVATIGLKDVLDTELFLNSKAPLTFALGKDIAGESKICNLETMPHLLVAGATGSGKSVCLNVILISLLYKLGPNDLKILLIDPKRVEFVTYNYLPHMLTPKAINDTQQALNALDWAIQEMTRRYDLFSEKHVRNLKEYNSLPEVYRGEDDKLPYIVVVVDEMGDLMMLAGHELEEKIQRLTQLARAAGIHLIIATQRPSVNVITGVIKSNLTSRIAFAVTDFASSKTILDRGGADKLLGRGDMLYSPQDLPEPIRIQCPFVDGKEVSNIVDFIKEHNASEFDDDIADFILNGDKTNNNNGDDAPTDPNGWDTLMSRALLDFIQAGEGSASMIQRRHCIGYVRAGRIVDQMEKAGFISGKDPSKQMRTVFITMDKYKEIFGDE